MVTHDRELLDDFDDLKTAWIIEGIGHGHDDLDGTDDPEILLERDGRHRVASPAVRTHTKITSDNIHTFHFHGDPGATSRSRP